jgi:hypothetical protein
MGPLSGNYSGPLKLSSRDQGDLIAQPLIV